MMERRWKGNIETSASASASCPRCGSCNTKFCYYNNYSLTQPRYFCKGCRRYWTKGGSLRNVPLRGASRKTRRPSSRSSSSSLHYYSNSTIDDHAPPPHIDIALVYANFLNPNNQLLMQTSPVLDHSVQLQHHYSSSDGPNICTQVGPIIRSTVGLPLLPQHHNIYSGGLFNCMPPDTIIDQYCTSISHDYSFNLPLPALPPIPLAEEEEGEEEEAASIDDDHPIMWSASHDQILMVNHGMQAPPLSPPPHDDVADSIMANWDPFHHNSFPKP